MEKLKKIVFGIADNNLCVMEPDGSVAAYIMNLTDFTRRGGMQFILENKGFDTSCCVFDSVGAIRYMKHDD